MDGNLETKIKLLTLMTARKTEGKALWPVCSRTHCEVGPYMMGPQHHGNRLITSDNFVLKCHCADMRYFPKNAGSADEEHKDKRKLIETAIRNTSPVTDGVLDCCQAVHLSLLCRL